MSKKSKEKNQDKKQELEKRKKIYDTKTLLIRYLKRYGIILLISLPFILIFNFVMENEVEWYHGAVSIFMTLGLLLLACLIGVIVYTKKDEKEEREMTKEKERDPFAD